MINTNTMHFALNNKLFQNVGFSIKTHKIYKITPTCFDLNRSSSGSMPVPR